MAIQSLIFDFDGLILDTESPIFQSWQELYNAHGCQLALSTWEGVIGTAEGSLDLFEILEAQLGRPVDRAGLSPPRWAREAELVAVQRLLPGVGSYLTTARHLGLKIGLASSSARHRVISYLEQLGLLDFFDCLRTAEDVRVTKPDPALYLSALDCLGLAPDQAIALEDSPNGILAAKRAGLYCVAVPNAITRHLSLELADLLLPSLEDLPLEELLSIAGRNGHEG